MRERELEKDKKNKGKEIKLRKNTRTLYTKSRNIERKKGKKRICGEKKIGK